MDASRRSAFLGLFIEQFLDLVVVSPGIQRSLSATGGTDSGAVAVRALGLVRVQLRVDARAVTLAAFAVAVEQATGTVGATLASSRHLESPEND
jgi:hypothetical protein